MLLIFRKEEWLITIKELEIIIKDNVEEVTNKIKKQIPQIKQQIKGVTDTVKQVIGQISVKSIIDKAQQAISSVKKKLQSLKAINKSNDLKIKVNNEDAKKQITQTEKKIDSLKTKIGRIRDISSKISEGFSKSLSPIKGMGKGMISIIKHIGSFLSLENIYSKLKSSADAWLSSQNSEAQQLSANIDYMKTAMGSVFAPVIVFVTNLVYQLMKAVQSLVYAFTGVNIFAKSTATSMNKTAGGASKASKSLSGIHSEINNVSSNESNGGGDNGGSAGPNIDLSQMDSQMSHIAEKMYSFFSPLVESWNNYGLGLIEQVKTTAGEIGELISSVWGSFENIITNGTVYSILQNIFGIIGNIAEAFSNAWNYNGNGDAIIQNLANSLDNLLIAIDNIIKSEGFQAWLDWCSDKFREISEVILSINWQPLLDALIQVGTIIGGMAIEALNIFVNCFKWFVEHPEISGVILAIVAAYEMLSTILAVVAALKESETIAFVIGTAVKMSDIGETVILMAMYAAEAIQAGIATAATWLFNVAIAALTSPITLVILAIAAFVAAIVAIITHWNEISTALAAGWEWIKQKAVEIFNGIKDAISTAFNTVKDIVSNIWNNIVEGISNAWNNIITKVKEGVSGAWNAITSVFGNIAGWFRDKFTQAWSAVKNVFSAGGKIFDGIKDGIVNAFKSVVNAIIRGINKVISIPFNAINGVLSGIRNISIAGIEPFTWIHTFNVPQIPELATGNVAYDRTLAIFGEYSGVSSNPEITTPQNIMRETFNEVLESREWNNNKQPVRVQIYWGTKAVVDEIIDGINEKTRQTGKAQIKVAYA